MKSIIIFLLLILTSCSVCKDLTGEKVCRVVDKKYGGRVYYRYTCITLFSMEKVYLSGFKDDANVGDTAMVVIRPDGFNYFKKGER